MSLSTTIWPFTFLRPYRERRAFSTTVQSLANGRELRRPEFGDLGRLTVSSRVRLPYGSKTLADWIAFWTGIGGAASTFLLKAHHAAHKTQTLEAVGTGDGTTTAFALDKRYIDEATLLVYKDAVLQTLTTHYTFGGNETAPTITFVSAPAGAVAITATYDYYHPVRFVSDEIEPHDLHLTGSDATAIVEIEVDLVEIAPEAHVA